MCSFDLSVIVPAYNEERFIGKQVRSVRDAAQDLSVQIIVVDNGSVDRTRELARQAGADLVLCETGTVGALRNAGARCALAPVLSFMDADVFPTREWGVRIHEVLATLRSDGQLLTGSWVSVPQTCSWLERHWFKPLEHGQNTHMNSGHMILTKQLFEQLQGFDERLRTGEDFDLSMRAKAAGARIVDDVSLRVIHEGYPKTVAAFMRREIWHGTGDWQTSRTLLGSRVAAAGFIVLHSLLLGIVGSVWIESWWPVFGAFSLTLLISSAASKYRYRKVACSTRAATTFLYVAYFVARGLSPYAVLRRATRRTRTLRTADVKRA